MMSFFNNKFISLFLFSVVIIIHVSATISSAKISKEIELNITSSHFPDGFLFGAATSAYQIEGAYLEDGKGLSNWDVFSNTKGNIQNGENGDIADDHYHRYMEDIELLHSLGVKAYRFSISWTRILPKGRFGEVNLAGIQFYDKIIDNLLLKGIQPFVTIHHCDFPQELEDRYESWLSPQMQEDFVYFAEVCFKNFGDRVKYWMTINEPNLTAQLSYELGIFPPLHCSPPFGNCSIGNSVTEPLIAMHNMLLSHAKATKLYRDQFQREQGGVIGMVGHAYMYRPLTSSKLDEEAASRAMAFSMGWVFDPLVYGDYPSEMHQYYKTKMPKFTSEEKKIITDSIDFIGINHYTALYVKDCSQSSDCNDPGSWIVGTLGRGSVYITGEKDGVLIGEPTGMPGFYVVPSGMEDIVEYMKIRYHNKPMFITENGYSPPENHAQGADELLHDVKRIEYHKSYLAYLARAIRNGADVRGYMLWTLMDDFEWTSGFNVRFGLHYVNPPTTLERVPRSSSKWYKDFLTNNNNNNNNNSSLKPTNNVNNLVQQAKNHIHFPSDVLAF